MLANWRFQASGTQSPARTRTRRRLRRPENSRKAIVWKEFHFHAGGYRLLGLKLLLLLLGVVLATCNGDSGYHALLLLLCMPLVILEMAVHSSQLMSEELHEPTYDCLRLAISNTGELRYQKMRARKVAIGWSLGILALLSLVALLEDWGGRLDWLLFFAGGLLSLFTVVIHVHYWAYYLSLYLPSGA
ncbi:MAG: hypothetical protein ACI8W8_003507 [Rhodothermales bacterium]|jgi:hypothetical protein